MAKSPRKGYSASKSGYSQKLNPKMYPSPRFGGKGGKNFKGYNFQLRRDRRLSIADLMSSETSEEPLQRQDSGSDSESSLTAMSEDDETAASRKGSVFFENADLFRKQKLKKSKPARKKFSRKVYKHQEEMSDEDDDEDDDDIPVLDFLGDDDDEEALGAIYSIPSASKSSSSSSESDSSDEESSDDSEVDFVQLQAERRAKSMKQLRGIKGVPKPAAKPQEKVTKRRRSSAFRRPSEVALPEGINFKFEFDDGSAIAEEDEQMKLSEEDLGEEVAAENSYDLQFPEPAMDVPKFKDEDFVSEDDYEFDDNDLLATLQQDNDLDEFLGEPKQEKSRTRQSSVSSVNDDTEDPFLREEEKYLVNEFEVNGFDDENEASTAKVMNSFNNSNTQKKQVLQYASSSDEDDDEKKYDEDDYVDFIDFDTPFMDRSESELKLNDRTPIQSPKKAKKKKQLHKSHKKKGPLDSEEEDDSYLWNYFFSSDADSDRESEPEVYDLEEQFLLEQIFRQDQQENGEKSSENAIVGAGESRELSLEPVESDHEYDLGELTDVDLSLPTSKNQAGSKLAKEVLLSKTADYRPPVLGTWVAVDCKPFGIIDGLSTRTLNQATKNPRLKTWRSFSIKPDLEDSAIELDELLNISELDNDDENDIRIWRDFNNNKKQVPLGAFRNKLHINQQVVPEPMMSKYPKKERVRRNSKVPIGGVRELDLPSKARRRRQLNADAVSEGYRPTKSGLFSENVIQDVEEILGDDRDFMALIKGL